MPTIANMAKVNGITIAGAITEAHTLLRTETVSSGVSTVSFTTRIDSTFDVFEFRFKNIHPATDNVNLTFQANTAGASGFNETITSTFFYNSHSEGDAVSGPGYEADFDQAQGTAYQILANYVGNDNDQSCSGVLTLYDPSSTTYVKHFVSRLHDSTNGDYARDNYAAGYINTTSPIDEISFKMSSGNIDAGVIKMYGVAKS